jgi:hypothetical protein
MSSRRLAALTAGLLGLPFVAEIRRVAGRHEPDDQL